MLETVGKEHFEHVVENPRFGVGHTLRTLGLHAAVLYLGAHLARLGWNEFFEWGGGPIGQILLSPSPAVVGGDVIELNGNDGYGYFGSAASTSTDPERGGTGFALLLLYDLAVTATEVGLSALKYTTNLLELHKDPDSAYTEEGSLEQTVFFTRLGQAILGASRTVYMFKSCGHCALVRKVCIRIMSTINGGQTFNRIHSAACRIVLAREMDVAFPDATEQELKTMAADESCAICLKTMTTAKRGRRRRRRRGRGRGAWERPPYARGGIRAGGFTTTIILNGSGKHRQECRRPWRRGRWRWRWRRRRGEAEGGRRR
ncbi:unnamed protein product [Ectocarpus sp. 8 AP-2014]